MAAVAVMPTLLYSSSARAQDVPTRLPQGRRLLQSHIPGKDSDVDRFIAESREMLQLFQVGESQLDLFSDGEPLSDDGLATLIRLLYRAPAFPSHKVHRWQQWQYDLAELRHQPSRFRGAFMRLTGRVKSIEKISVPENFRQRFGFNHFFCVTLRDGDESFLVYCRLLPVGWGRLPTGDDGPWASTSAMFVKLGAYASTASDAPLVAVTNTLAWHPRQIDLDNGITVDHVRLASLGMDINQFSFVEDRTSLTASDRECFYQLLDVAGRVPQRESMHAAVDPVDVTTLLQNPESHRARHYAVVGTVRRAVRIQVEDIDIVTRFGIDHYYELEVFTSPNVTVRFVDEQGDDKVFSRYPVVVCMRDVPDWLPLGEGVYANVVVSGFFLKHWAYRTPYMSAGTSRGAAERLQISPLLVGTRVTSYSPALKSNGYFGFVGGTLFTLGLLAMAWLVWKSEKSNREFRRKRLSRSDVDLDFGDDVDQSEMMNR